MDCRLHGRLHCSLLIIIIIIFIYYCTCTCTCTVRAGRLSGCPGYVGLTVNSREDREQLLRYDVLVMCPAVFNVTLKLPNWHQQTDKTFDLQLTDAQRTHLVFLTHLTFDPIAQRAFYHALLLSPSLEEVIVN